jgi:splicing factor 3B subunit 3
MDGLVNYHLGEVVTAIQCGKVDLKKPERIFYSTIDGKIGMFYPMESEEEGELAMLRRLEEEMSKSSIAGASNHKLFRNQFSPAKGVIDGDFCELFQSLSESEKLRLSASLGKEPK